MYAKEDLYVTMEPLPELGINQYIIECTACSKACTFHFRNHRKLPFAFVAGLAGAFSSPCRKLEKENARRAALDGQKSLISAANDGWADPAISSCGVFTTRDGE